MTNNEVHIEAFSYNNLRYNKKIIKTTQTTTAHSSNENHMI